MWGKGRSQDFGLGGGTKGLKANFFACKEEFFQPFFQNIFFKNILKIESTIF